MQIVKEMSGFQILFRLIDGELEHTLGQAVISENDGEIRFHTLYVRPQYRGRGYGSALMRAVLSEGGGKPITLCTGFGNVSFFKRHDFKVTDISDSLVFMRRETSH